jgi:TRAP-type mannitol/chloroaromatic compound transport system permease small subunit
LDKEGCLVRRFLYFLDEINGWTGRIFSWTIVVISLLVVTEVIMRRFLNSPTIWNFEVVKQLYGFYFMILAGYTLLNRGHVAVDLIHEKLKLRNQAILNAISYIIFFFPFCVIMLKEGITFANTSWQMKETSWSVFAPPLYPIKTVIPVAAFLLLIQGLSIFIRQLFVLVKGESYD